MPEIPGDCWSPTTDLSWLSVVTGGRGDLSPFHRCKGGDRVEVTCRGRYQEARMSALPRPETLVPCSALLPSPSFVPEPVVLPRCDLRKGGQDKLGGDLSCHLRHEPELAAGIYPSSEKSVGCAKNRDLPLYHSTDATAVVSSPKWEVFVLCGQSWPVGRGRTWLQCRQASAQCWAIPWSWAGAVGHSAVGLSWCLRKGWVQVPE